MTGSKPVFWCSACLSTEHNTGDCPAMPAPVPRRVVIGVDPGDPKGDRTAYWRPQARELIEPQCAICGAQVDNQVCCREAGCPTSAGQRYRDLYAQPKPDTIGALRDLSTPTRRDRIAELCRTAESRPAWSDCG